MDPRVRQVLGGKRLALMRRIAHELSWPDTVLFDDLAVGFRLTGYLDRTGVFASDVKPATMDLDEFWASASQLISVSQVMPALVQGTTSLTLSSNACATPTRSGISFPESIYFVASVRLFLPLFGQEQSNTRESVCVFSF